MIHDPITIKLKTKENLNIVISSAGGGVGVTMVEYLNKLGYERIFGIAGSDKKCKFVEQLGCKTCLNYKNFYDGRVIRAKEF